MHTYNLGKVGLIEPAPVADCSIDKPNPIKERTLALNIGREQKIDFLIPLNVDGLKATDLDFMTSDLTFIQFKKKLV